MQNAKRSFKALLGSLALFGHRVKKREGVFLAVVLDKLVDILNGDFGAGLKDREKARAFALERLRVVLNQIQNFFASVVVNGIAVL